MGVVAIRAEKQLVTFQALYSILGHLNPRPLQDRPRTSGQSRSSENYPNPRVAHRPKYANQESSNGYPDFNGSGSDNDNNLNPDWITDPDKWDKIQESLSLGSKESEEDLDSSPPDHSCSSTSSLTKEELKKYPLLPMQPSYFKDWEGQDCSFRQAEGKRKVYTYGPVLGLDGDFAPCPPPSSTKVQRENCMVPTNENILELRDRFKSHVQSTNAEMAKFEAPCPYRSDQKARMYLNILTGECFYTHAEGKTDVMGKFWGFKQLTPAEIREYRREAIEAGTWRTPNSDYRDYTN